MAKRKSSKRGGIPKVGRVLSPTASVGRPVLPATTKVNWAPQPSGKK